jgi:hypothetical protein
VNKNQVLKIALKPDLKHLPHVSLIFFSKRMLQEKGEKQSEKREEKKRGPTGPL